MTTCPASKPSKRALHAALAGAIALVWPVAHAAGDDDALNLQSAPVESEAKPATPLRLFAEGAIGRSTQRFGLSTQHQYRASLDLRWSGKLAPGWKAALSDRLDALNPAEPGKDPALNSLREAYVTWSDEASKWEVDLGRIDLRYGPGYGYNPTDFFRDGSLRAFTTANPLALRENRMGSVIVRGQRLWTGGSAAILWSPKLADDPSPEALSLDLGSTNSRGRGLLVVGVQPSERFNAQFLLYKDRDLRAQPGLTGTALLSRSWVAHGEWSAGREPTLADRAWGIRDHEVSGQRFAGGLTFTTATQLSLTVEYQANGFALSKAQWDAAAAANPALLAAYLREAQRRQELPSRRGWFVFANQRDLGIKKLDLTAFVQINPADDSHVAWLELRYHWDAIDLALQLQDNVGEYGSIYGSIPDRRSATLLLAYRFR